MSDAYYIYKYEDSRNRNLAPYYFGNKAHKISIS